MEERAVVAEEDDYFPGYELDAHTNEQTEVAVDQRKQKVLSKYFHDHVVSTFQSTTDIQERKSRLRILNQIASLERKTLFLNQESEILQEKLVELKLQSDQDADKIERLKKQLDETLKKELPLAHFDFTPTTPEGTFDLPHGVLYSNRVRSIKEELDETSRDRYACLSDKIPSLQTTLSDIQKELWRLNSELLELSPQKKRTEQQEKSFIEELALIADFKKDRMVREQVLKKERQQKMQERLRNEEMAAARAEQLKEEKLRKIQEETEKRALSIVREAKEQELKLKKQKEWTARQKEKAMAQLASEISLNRKRAKMKKAVAIDQNGKKNLNLERMIQDQHDVRKQAADMEKHQQERRKLDIVAGILNEEERRRAKNGNTWKPTSALKPIEEGVDIVNMTEEDFDNLLKEHDVSHIVTDHELFADSDEEEAHSRRSISSRSHRSAHHKTLPVDELLDAPDYAPIWEKQQPLPEANARILSNDPLPILPKRKSSGKSNPPFSFSPASLEFKDFFGGKVYRRNVVITNTSGHVNSFKLLPLAFDLTPFFSFEYSPPGRLSAGMTSSLTVVFHPQSDSEADLAVLNGVKLQIMSESGLIVSLPLICLEPQCIPSVRSSFGVIDDESEDTLIIDLGKCSIGETVQSEFEITNAGFIGAKFWVRHTRSEQEKLDNTVKTGSNDSNINSQTDISECMFQLQGLQQANPNTLIYSGQILGYSSSTVTIKFHPKVLGGRYRTEFSVDFVPPNVERKLIQSDSTAGSALMGGSMNTMALKSLQSKSHAYIEGIVQKRLVLIGEVVDLPIYVEKENINFQWMMTKTCYREKVVIRNRTSIAQRFYTKLEVKDGGHIKETNVIGNGLYDIENIGSLEVSPNVGFVQPNEPFSVWLKLRPSQKAVEHLNNGDVPFDIKISFFPAKHNLAAIVNLNGKVTEPNLVVEPSNIDFGQCSIFDGVLKKIRLTSKSRLISKYGFVDAPDCIGISPSDGFGSLLPLETSEHVVVFSPKSPGEYTFNLTVKTVDGGSSVIKCTGTAIQPLIQFAPNPGNVITFVDVAAGAKKVATCVLNVPVEEGASVFAKDRSAKFEFALPVFNGIDSAGTPVWNFSLLNEEVPVDEKLMPFKIYPRVGSLSTGHSQCVHVTFSPRWSKFFANDMSQESTSEVKDEDKSLYENYNYTWKLPCFVQHLSGGNQQENVIFLEIRANIVEPLFELVGDNGEKLDFGQAPLGVTLTKNVFLRAGNTITEPVLFSVKGLNPFGPFTTVQKGEIQPGQNIKFAVSFNPSVAEKVYEKIELLSEDQSTSVQLKLLGEGVVPSVALEPRNRILCISDTLVGETSSKFIVIHNTSSFSSSIKVKCLREGMLNTNGISPFAISPTAAVIEPGKNQEIIVTFSPDHESDYFWDVVEVYVDGLSKPLRVRLIASCWSTTLFVSSDQEVPVYRVLTQGGGDKLNPLNWSAPSSAFIDDLALVYNRVYQNRPNTPNEEPVDTNYQLMSRFGSNNPASRPAGLEDIVGKALSPSSLNECLLILASQRNNDSLASQLSEENKPSHPMLSLPSPLNELSSASSIAGHCKRLQIVNIPSRWKMVSKLSGSTQGVDYSKISSSIVSLNNENDLLNASEPLFRLETHFLMLINSKIGGSSSDSKVVLPDPKKVPSATGEFMIEEIADINSLGSHDVQLQLRRLRDTSAGLVNKTEHGLRFVLDGPSSGTLEAGSQKNIRLGLVGPKMERLDFLLEKNSRPSTAAKSVLGAVRRPLFVESFFKITMKGGLKIVGKHQGQPIGDGPCQVGFSVSTTATDMGGRSAASTFAKTVVESLNSRVWIVRVFTVFDDDAE